MNRFYRMLKIIAPAIFHVFCPYRILNRPPKPEGAAVICANHVSFMDPVFLALASPRQIFYMAKAELFRNRFFAAFIRKLGASPVVRGAGGSAIQTANEILARGDVLGIFPEGTRSKTGAMQAGKSGVVLIAHQNHAPIYPMAIACAGKRPRIFRRTRIVCGEPIWPEELNIREGTAAEYRNATRMVMQRIAALQQQGWDDLHVHPIAASASAEGGKA